MSRPEHRSKMLLMWMEFIHDHLLYATMHDIQDNGQLEEIGKQTWRDSMPSLN